VQHHYLTFGYRIGKDGAMFSVIPSANIKFAAQLPPSFDLTCMVNFNNIIDVGLQYRFIDGVNAIVNLRLKSFTIGYAYDYNLSAIKYGSGNGHELIFGYRYCVFEPTDKVKEHCPAYR
jgi:Type IX secretion system membrane protein PorP/SprF